MNEQQTMPLAIALSRTLGIPVASEDAVELEQRLTAMIQNAFAKGAELAREECCKAIDEIDDGEAPEYRACQEAIRAMGQA